MRQARILGKVNLTIPLKDLAGNLFLEARAPRTRDGRPLGFPCPDKFIPHTVFLCTLRGFLAGLDGRALLAPELPVTQIVRAKRPERLDVLINYLDFLGALPAELAATMSAGALLRQKQLRELSPG